jgi:hypothetical protein
MAFESEPTGYQKTVLSDLQGAWQNLRAEVAEQAGFPGWDKALFHIDEVMSWESVRNLQYMHRCLVLVRNILAHPDVPEDVRLCLEEVNGCMEETLEALKEGKIR